MSGTVRRRGEGDWEYRLDAVADPLTGRRHRPGRSGFKTKREAAKALRDALTAQERGRSVKTTRRSVKSFLDEWHTAIRPSVRPSTWANYRDYLDAYVIPIIGDIALQDLTPVRLNLLYSHLLERGRIKRPGGLAPKTVQNVHRILHRALRDAVKWDILPRNVAEDADPPKAPSPRPKIWTPAQLNAFVCHVRQDRYFALWLLVVTTGLRRGELAGLVRDDIDLEAGTVSPSAPRVVVSGHAQESRTKTRSGERSLALDPDTVSALRGYLERWENERHLLGHRTELLFVRIDGRPLHPDTITALFLKHCAEAGLPRIRLHEPPPTPPILPHRATPAGLYDTMPKATPGPWTDTETHDRVRADTVSKAGNVTLRIGSRMHHIRLGRTYARTCVLLLVQDLDVRVVNATTGELLRELTIDP